MKLLSRKKENISENSAETIKTKKKFTKKQLRVISIILVVVITIGCFFSYKVFFGKENNAKAAITAVASRGNVSSVIEGSGTLEALQQYEITSLIKGEVVADYFEEGDMVEKDDVLYQMDDEAGMESIDNARSSLKKAQRSYEDATKSISDLIVKSKSSGVVTQMYIEIGDNVNANTKVADVIDNSNMILEIQFLSDYASAMRTGVSTAEVTLSKNGTVLNGKVTKVSSGEIINSVGARVTNVEITVSNPGAIKAGDYATASVGGFACSSEGTFKNSGKSAVYTEVAGKVEKLNIMTGDNISYGQTVAILSNENLVDIDETADNYTDAKNKYDDAVEALDDYVVKAPISGKIIQKNIKAGEKMDNNSSSVMAIIADLSSLVFQMSVDELDISKLEVGMDVEITADAIEGVTFLGKVTNISIVGTSNNGVTTYPVKITLNQKDDQTGMAYESYDKLIPGLNVSGSVVIEKAEDVIVVPVSAVRRGNIVIVSEDSTSEGVGMEGVMGDSTEMPSFGDKGEMARGSDGINEMPMPSDGSAAPAMPDKNKTGDKSSADNNSKNRLQNMLDSIDVPKGYKAIFVETGLSDETYIEIKSGLNEGDVVLLPDTTQTGTDSEMQNQMPGGMPMGGGMPSGGGMPGGGGMPSGGGMPGGGMRGGNR